MIPPASHAHVVPRPAATVVLLRSGRDGLETLLTRRPPSMAFAADVHVFPGGAVDPGDADQGVGERLGPGWRAAPADERAAAVAAIREAFEEAGVLLARDPGGAWLRPDEATLDVVREGLAGDASSMADALARLDRAVGGEVRLAGDALVPLSRWVTPPVMPRRFDVRFLAAALPDGAEPTFTTGEVVAHRWLRPAEALEEMAAGRLELWLPTSTTLAQLAHARSIEEVREQLSPAAPWVPPVVTEVVPGIRRIAVAGAGAVPGQTANGWLVGARRLVLVDHGDPSEAAADAVLRAAAAGGGSVVAVVLTSAAPDHVAGAEGLAMRLDVPVLAGRGAAAALPHDVVEMADGDRVNAGDMSLRVVATPGPRPEHVALEVVGRDIVLAGDLVGPGPERSIPPPVDEAAHAASVARVAALGTRLVLPGHGEPLAGEVLERSLASGRARGQTVFGGS